MSQYTDRVESAKALLANHEEFCKRITEAGLGCLACPQKGEPAYKMSWAERCMATYRIKTECNLASPFEQKVVPFLLALAKILPCEETERIWQVLHPKRCIQPTLDDMTLDDYAGKMELP